MLLERLFSIDEDSILWKKACCYVVCMRLNILNDDFWISVFSNEGNLNYVSDVILLADQYLSFLILRNVTIEENIVNFKHLSEPLQDQSTETILSMF